MRLSEVDICNQAIGLCGSSDFIQSLTDNKVSAQRCEKFLEGAVERVLRSHDWTSATVVVQLARNTLAPTSEWDYSYALPHDCVKLVNVYGSSSGYSPYDRWEPVKRNIHTDLGVVFLKYVQFPEDYADLDVLLSTAIAYELAIMLAPTYIKNPEVYAILSNAHVKALARAKAMDTLERKDLYVENDVWEDVRSDLGGSRGAYYK
jgi:hypothetical protein